MREREVYTLYIGYIFALQIEEIVLLRNFAVEMVNVYPPQRDVIFYQIAWTKVMRITVVSMTCNDFDFIGHLFCLLF